MDCFNCKKTDCIVKKTGKEPCLLCEKGADIPTAECWRCLGDEHVCNFIELLDCNGCTKREIGCHETCSGYIRRKKKRHNEWIKRMENALGDSQDVKRHIAMQKNVQQIKRRRSGY